MRSTPPNDGNSHRESGAVQILLVFALVALIAAASLSIDALRAEFRKRVIASYRADQIASWM